MSYLYILEINPLSIALFASIFSHSEACHFVHISFAVKRLLIRSICFFFNFYCSLRWIKKDVAIIYIRECYAYVSL